MVIGDLLGFVHLIIPSARGSKMDIYKVSTRSEEKEHARTNFFFSYGFVAFKLADFFLTHGDGKIFRSVWIEMEEVQEHR